MQIPAGEVVLAGDLEVPERPPERPLGVVVFAHGSGSSRFSPRNRQVAAALQQQGLATLLLDLLSDAEGVIDERTRELRFDIGLLADRLVAARDWLAGPDVVAAVADLPVGYFGASTGAAAALVACARQPGRIAAVVSRGGRPDLAGTALRGVDAPTLLLVGGLDDVVIGMNQDAAAQLDVEHRLEIVPGATHLFEEPGTLEVVAAHAAGWFRSHFGGA